MVHMRLSHLKLVTLKDKCKTLETEKENLAQQLKNVLNGDKSLEDERVATLEAENKMLRKENEALITGKRNEGYDNVDMEELDDEKDIIIDEQRGFWDIRQDDQDAEFIQSLFACPSCDKKFENPNIL